MCAGLKGQLDTIVDWPLSV